MLRFIVRALARLVRLVVASLSLSVLAQAYAGAPETIFEKTSAHHHIRVYDKDGIRTLSFDGSMETRMSLRNPAEGHFEYTEFFHMPWLWNGLMTNILMVGLGGGSTQRSYAHHYPHMTVETVEIDPAVVEVAKAYFHFKESPKQIVHVADGRVFLRRTEKKYGAILMDAYVENRYGSSIPHHLATKEFFALASDRLATNGVLAYNVIGTLQALNPDIVGTIYKTMKTIFPHVYSFPARTSRNVVLIGTKSPDKVSFNTLHTRAGSLIYYKRITLPTFRDRLYSFRAEPPQNQQVCKVVTDDFAPLDGLLSVGR